jgi:hypothetical protein
MGLVGAVFVHAGAWGLGICFFTPGMLGIPAAIFLGHSGFEKFIRIANFFSGFGGV